MKEISLIKKRLREARENSKLTRPQVAEKINIPRATIEGWEMTGSLPRLDKAKILSELYNVSLDYIVCKTDNPEVNKGTPKDNSKITK